MSTSPMPDTAPTRADAPAVPDATAAPPLGLRTELAALGALVVLPLLPFLGKAFSIDAPVFLAMARQILEAPADPYGFDMVWDSSSPHAAAFNRNPPLLSYYLAPFVALFGDSEVALHGAALPFAVTAAFAFYGIARRVAGDGLAPAALLVATPAFLVLATTLMLDVPVLACMLVAVYALLRSAEPGAPGGWAWLSGAAAAAAGLAKYVGFSIAPLLAAGVWLLHPRPLGAALRVLGVPAAVWALWGIWTAHLYGTPHFLGSTDVVFDRSLDPDEVWNQAFSAPIYYGAALLFPVFAWVRASLARTPGTEIAVVAALVAVFAVAVILPEGEPPRRIPLGRDESALAALGFAGGGFLCGACLRPARSFASRLDGFLALWLGGLLVFAMFVNWHVNAADALLAAPPALLLLFRSEALRPSRRLTAVWVAAMLPLAFALAWADARQAGAYRAAAQRIVQQIGDQSGARWFVGNWGLQHYLEREGFRAVEPPTYGDSPLAKGDWVASARNVSQMDVWVHMDRYDIRGTFHWLERTRLPLRTNNADAGAGFYSHHAGYVPFAFDTEPLDRVGLARVVRVKDPRAR